jgi:hypothetical protein
LSQVRDSAETKSIKLQRLGIIMVPEKGNENEVEGVLNPAGGTSGDHR